MHLLTRAILVVLATCSIIACTASSSAPSTLPTAAPAGSPSASASAQARFGRPPTAAPGRARLQPA
ncbi:MAG TPA: hypothetical protein VN839_00725, partial [Patescibacteria group bacterium]|nr:hypothetical protein [Patescibacteria group bacterium]